MQVKGRDSVEQKFIKLEEAVDRLGISSERLNQLREQGEIRAYRDGSSWKFRTDEIEKLVTDGLHESAPPSDIGLVDVDDLVEAEPLVASDTDEDDGLTLADDVLEIHSGSDLTLESSGLELAGSDLEGGDLEGGDLDDTVPADKSDLVLDNLVQDDLDQDRDGDLSALSDSILLSEEQLGESATGSASTIIGKSELEDADLELAAGDSALSNSEHGMGSDVKLASHGSASHVLSSASADSDDVLDLAEEDSKLSKAFEDLDELEIDLAAESSRILNPEDVAQVKAEADGVGSVAPRQKPDSDLQLDDLELAVSDSSMGTGDSEKTGISSLELDTSAGSSVSASDAEEGGISDIELASGDSDFVLADSGGSDLSMGSADSGINLIDPSDSGLALDDIPLEIGGSAILESLSLGGEGSDSELSLVAGDSNITAGDSFAELQTDDDFQLTPMGKGDADADDSSSQVIALDEGIDDLDSDALEEGLVEDDLLEDSGEAMVLTEEEEATGFENQPVSVTAAASPGDYTVWNILSLGACVMLLMIGGTMMLDMIRNIWSWNQPYALNSTLLDGLMGIFGLN